jgi:DegV family protein with EDD domain
MEPICLLTDGCAQFSSSSFRGSEHIYSVIPEIESTQTIRQVSQEIKTAEFPDSLMDGRSPKLLLPEYADVCKTITTLSEKYNHIIAILASRAVNPQYDLIEKAIRVNCGKIKSQLIHSHAVSAGLGYLLEAAASAASDGITTSEIEYQIREKIPHVYTTLATNGWSYLHQSGLVDQAQAVVGEMLGMISIFALEEAGMAPVQKVRNEHGVFEYFLEFLDEFDNLEQITLLSHHRTSRQDADKLRDHIHDAFPFARFSEIPLNATNAVIFGPRTIGLTVVEKSGA